MTTALERNDRYLREFVEAFSLCPFAKRCRETGKLHRRVVARGESLESHLSAVEALPDGSVEVGLLLCPEFTGSARDFEAAVAGLRTQAAKFYCVAFHPDLPKDLGDAHRAVQFIRRSPDPTVQLVHIATLQAVRAGREGGSLFFDTKRLSTAELLALAGTKSLSDAIAEQNLATIRREGPEKLEALLSSMRADGQ